VSGALIGAEKKEEEEANVTPKAPENNKEKKFQPQITSFFAKKK
jgi:hypothetical protein